MRGLLIGAASFLGGFLVRSLIAERELAARSNREKWNFYTPERRLGQVEPSLAARQRRGF